MQWCRNDQTLPEKREAVLSLKNLNTNDAGTYTVRVHNKAEDSVLELTSDPAHLMIEKD